MTFEAGKLYRYVGPNRRPLGWNNEGMMDYVLDGKPHKCTKGSGTSARFEDDNEDTVYKGHMWSWTSGLEHWRLATTMVIGEDGSFVETAEGL